MFNVSCIISLIFMMVPVQESTVGACFHTKLLIFFKSIAFTRFRTCTEEELSFKIIATCLRYMNTSCVNIIFCCLFFFREGLARLVKNKPTKKQIGADITLKQAPAGKRTEKKMFYMLWQQITKPNYKLQINITCVRMGFP